MSMNGRISACLQSIFSIKLAFKSTVAFVLHAKDKDDANDEYVTDSLLFVSSCTLNSFVPLHMFTSAQFSPTASSLSLSLAYTMNKTIKRNDW